MGTPAKTQKPATPTKKMTRLRLPSGRSNGSASQNRPITTATVATAVATIRQSAARSSRSKAKAAIRPMPAGSAAARHMLEICSAGVVM